MNVILIVLDSLRQDHVGCYGRPPWMNHPVKTPNLDAFAAQAVRFTNAYPEALPTIPVRTALITGQRTLGFRPWQPLLDEDVTAAEIFSELGYVNAMVTDVYHMTKPGMNFSRGFHSFDFVRGQESDAFSVTSAADDISDYIHPAMVGTAKEQVVRQYLASTSGWTSDADSFPAQVFKKASQFVECIGQRPFFLWVDSFDPHEPWMPLGEFEGMYADPNYTGPKLIDALYSTVDYMTDEELAFLRAQYAAEVSMTDKWFGLLIDTLRRRRLLDSSVVMVMSDHGHPLGDHRKIMKHPDNLYGELLNMPFMVRLPDAAHAGETCDALVQTDDVLPSFLDYIGAGHESIAMHGRSFKPIVEGSTDRLRDYVVTGYHQAAQRCVRDLNWSYVYKPERSELYDLAADPLEQTNVIDRHPDIADAMHRKMGVFSFTKQGKIKSTNVQEQYEWSGTAISLDRNPTVTR